MNLLIPGRHQLMTNFQFEYLVDVIQKRKAIDLKGQLVEFSEGVSAIIFAVTSANHSNTRRNPLPFYLRAMSIQAFANELPVPVYVFGIDDVGIVTNFSDYTVKRIRHDSEGRFKLDPENTLVVCSTPVLEMYESSGFRVLPAELLDRTSWRYKTKLPWDIVEMIALNSNWQQDVSITKYMHPASLDLWRKYELGRKVSLLWKDKMIGDDGDITSTRDYNTYVRQMDEIADLKFKDTAAYIRAGRIGDIGCAVGSWLKLASADSRFRESDFYGIEVARQLYEICQQRKYNGEFGNPFVFFSQRNAVTGLVFDRNTMNTIHTSSLTHEIESYGSREELIAFIRNRYDELASGGVWVNRDVVGPPGKDESVLMELNSEDGRNNNYDATFPAREELANYLAGLSTYTRFLRFAKDFRASEGYRLSFTIKEVEGKFFVRLRLQDACEFMSKKDYVDNWQSEMHETFCFWDFGEWKQALEDVGFRVLPESREYTNEWIVKNRIEGKIAIYRDTGQGPKRLPYPATGMILLAEKP